MAYELSMRIWRGDRDGGDLTDYSVEVEEGEVVLDAIHRVQATQAGDMAVRWNCKAGKCGSCSAEVNGRPRLMCMTRLSDFEPTETITVTPMRAFPVVRDLVTDVSYNYEKARELPSFAPGPPDADGKRRMMQPDVERGQEFRKCIECFLCQDTCHVVRDHDPGPWLRADTLVLCATYSGDTEETLACFDAATALGAQRIVATTGGRLADAARAENVPVIPLPDGFQPRAAVAYMIVTALEVAALCGAAPGVRSEIDVAAAHAEALVAEWGPAAPGDCEAKRLAHELHGTIPQIAGAGLTAPVAYRWKTQINENAEMPAFCNELPELDHNEIVGWAAASQLGRFSAVFLDDSDLHPRIRRRIALTRELVAPHAAGTFVVQSRGESRIERVLSLVLLGDLVSLYLAILRGIDPTPVEVIDRLRDELAESG